MSKQSDFGREKSFIPDVLPWLVAAGALLFYLATLNHWVTLNSLPCVSQVAGWNWPQNTLPPLYLLATFPLRWLPVAWLPVGLNLFSAVCAALVLGQLARSVALLPQDRTQAQRDREASEFSLLTIPMAWLPVVFAAVVCGLQMTFWENAVSATSELLNLLLFAFVVRCLLEYRIDQRESWLLWAALVYGVGMASDWLLVLLLPFLVTALIWLNGLYFFNLRFLLRMAGLGLAGMLVYFISPWLQSGAAGAPAKFGEILHYSLASTKNIVVNFPLKSLWTMGLTTLVPLLFLGIRWAKSSGDSSPLGIALAAFMFHLVHGVLLFACLWVAFDPPFSPRLYPRQFGYGASWLQLYYLGALSTGYFAGYFLLVFGRQTGKESRRNRSRISFINAAVQAGVWLLLVVAVAGLLYKNLPAIRRANRPTLKNFAALLTKNLPAQSAVALADNPNVLLLADAYLHTVAGGGVSHVFLDTHALQFPAYHRFLQKTHPAAQWSDDFGTNRTDRVLGPPAQLWLLNRAAQNHEVFYLHPSFGYYFEQYYPEAHGAILQLKPYPTNAVTPPPSSAENLAANLAFWQRTEAEIFSTFKPAAFNPHPPKEPGLGGTLLNLFQLKREPDVAEMLISLIFSRDLDWLGVRLQASGQITNAAWCFQKAHDLYPDNIAAEINLLYNQTALRDGNRTAVALTKSQEDMLARFRNWEQILNACGPVDEPQFCYQQGVTFAQGRLYRQAAQEFLRARALSPNNQNAYPWLATIYNLWHFSDPALEVVRAGRKLSGDPANQTALISAEANAYFNKSEPQTAIRILETAVAAAPADEALLNAALRLYLAYQLPTNALAVVDRLLQVSPDSPAALNNQGFIYLQLGQYSKAIPPLDHLLSLQPNNAVGLLNRAIARFQSGQLESAKQDYEALQILSPSAYQVQYGLGEIACRQKETAAAISHYQNYLTNAPPRTAEFTNVTVRLKELQGR